MIKVALVGAHGVGKTTIAYELAGLAKRKNKTVELLTEIARECPFPLNDYATSEAHQWIIARQVQLEIEKSSRADILICDRSVLDNFAYYARRHRPDAEEYQALSAYCYSWMKTYTLLVRLAVIEPPADDGFRSTDVIFQLEIDQLCDKLFDTVYGQRSKPVYIRGLASAAEIATYLDSL